MADFSGLLVKVRGDGKAFAEGLVRTLAARSVEVEPILRLPPQKATPSFGLEATGPMTWLRLRDKGAGADNGWDAAHALLLPGEPFAAAGAGNIEAVEPDLAQGWFDGMPRSAEAAANEADLCAFDDQNNSGGQAKGPGLAWNFNSDFTELKKARERVGEKLTKIIIAHLDTGYDPGHITRPANLRLDLQHNFVKDGFKPDDASDHTTDSMKFMRNRGHGTGTLSLLAGNRLDGHSPAWPGFADYLGAAALAQIIPVRVADWVVRFTTGTLVEGFNYARENGAHVLSMSMGGLSSQALVDAVNLAYEAGLVMVTAAGNNYAWVPTPKSIVFPARLKRVLAACGVMADGRAYAGLSIGTMQGNYGPAEKMETAIGAYTPNVPWAQITCGKVVDMDGAGTSAATPQVAAATALWLAEHWDAVQRYSQPWMRIEAVRRALFSTAMKSTPKMNVEETRQKIGQGVLRADAALASQPPAEGDLRKLPPAQASWSWLNVLFGGGGVSFALGDALSSQRRAMLALELTQMAQRISNVDEAIDDPGRPEDEIPGAARNRYLEAALDEGNPSKPLRAFLEALLGRPPAASQSKGTARPIKRKVRTPTTPDRRLRVYALDPSLGKRLDSLAVNETTLSVPWDDKPLTSEPLRPGPVGEYLEVVDIDPATNKIYDPVNLNDPQLLAQDGWSPSEGNPQFHQQMVYAVAMTTIRHFEEALGRKALWAPRFAKIANGSNGDYIKSYEVPRLRIYPHALRTDNAYYSPDKKALLFGYFPSQSQDGDATAPGSLVFSCLSSDIIAHEMTHALLDGLHRRFQEVSNLDVPAFHEGFADIVALFQHFTIPELVLFEIGRVRGDLSVEGLLGGLAKQFGEGSGRRGPLRDYVTAPDQKQRYPNVTEAHGRGSILVYAVYEAFRRIVARRTVDLIRLTTGGSGVLPDGAIHPDLVDRLTAETCKTAKHVLRMCIRALDYCPVVDITFGEYLRALVTADLDVVRDDHYGYRIAFMEAFRKWGILPTDVRTVSEETLSWNTLETPDPPWLRELIDGIELKWNGDLDRSVIYALNEKNRWSVFRRLKRLFQQDPSLYAEFGLIAGVPLYHTDGTIKEKRPAPDSTFEVHSVRPARRVAPDGSFRTEIIAVIDQRQAVAIDGTDVKNGFFWFRGGTTLIIDPREGHVAVRYSITKDSDSQSRLARQMAMATGTMLSPLRALYFGGEGQTGSAGEPFAMLHAAHGEFDNG